MNLLPNLKVEEMVRSFSVKSNDYMYVIYVSALIRSILSLHDLINNKIQAKEQEQENARKEQEREEAAKKAKEEAEKKKLDDALKGMGGDTGNTDAAQWSMPLEKFTLKSKNLSQ